MFNFQFKILGDQQKLLELDLKEIKVCSVILEHFMNVPIYHPTINTLLLFQRIVALKNQFIGITAKLILEVWLLVSIMTIGAPGGLSSVHTYSCSLDCHPEQRD